MARPGWSKRTPWPYDARVNGLGVMLKPGDEGRLIAAKSKPLDAAPATFQYETQQPFLERTYVLKDLWDGMGQATQPSDTPRRYSHAVDIDTSINGHAFLGPLFHAETIASGKRVRQLLVAQHNGVATLFALAGDSVIRRDADASWAVSLALGGGSQASQAVRFKPAGLDLSHPQIDTAERLPRGSVGKAYSYRLAASGGTAPYTWGIAVGHLPAGLTLAAATGVISGTPTAISSAAIQLRALDANNLLVAKDLAIRVESAAEPLAVDTLGMQAEGKLTEAYGAILEARGGTAPYTWAVTAGTLPSGLTLDSATGIISGTPTVQTTDPTPSFTVRATDAVAATATSTVEIRVRRPNDDYLYLASTASNLYRYDGSVWDVGAAWGGPPEAKAEAIAVHEKEIWVAWDNKLAKAEADPLERSNWAGAILLAGSDVTSLSVIGDAVVTFKRDGVFTINKDGSSQNLLPQMREVQVADNGQQAAVWLDSLWVPIGNAFYRFKPDGSFTPVGTEQLLENASEVRGRIVASAGHNSWHNYELLYDSETGASYLAKYGSWVEGADEQADPGSHFRAAHHGAIKKWGSKQGTAMAIVTASDLNETNDRLFVGFADGTIEWCYLPSASPNPMSDGICEFTDQRGYLTYPSHTANFAADVKNFRGFSIFGPILSNLLSARISYRLDPSSGYTTLADADLAPIEFTADGQRYNVVDAQLVGKTLDFRLELIRSAGASVNTSPLVYGVALHEQLRPAFVLEWTLPIETRASVARHDGTAERRSPEQIREALRVACAAYTPTTVILPDGASEDMGFLDYQEVLLGYDKRYGLAFDVTVRAMQYRTLSNIAQAQGLSYAALETYSYQELEGIL